MDEAIHKGCLHPPSVLLKTPMCNTMYGDKSGCWLETNNMAVKSYDHEILTLDIYSPWLPRATGYTCQRNT